MHYIVTDLGYGDAGKGSVVDWLCQREPVHSVVRFNGGAQAGHNVVAADGRHHTFAQFGSGTLTPGVRTHLSEFMLVDPLALASEADHLASLGAADALDRLTVDGAALLTTPYHAAAGQARELARGGARHGSCGMGIGETARYALEHPADAPRVRDCCAGGAELVRKLQLVRDRLAGPAGAAGPPPEELAETCRAFAARVRVTGPGYLASLLRRHTVVFEGAQGVLLDEWHGFHPYTTWSTTTFYNASRLLAEAGGPPALRIGVTRCYQTRHGPGPFVTGDPSLELPEPHNARGRWQGEFRTGHLDLVALRYALAACGGADVLALTHLDTAAAHPELRICRSYEMDGAAVTRLPAARDHDLAAQEALTRRLLRARPVYDEAPPDPASWPATIERALGIPVAVTSHGPCAADKKATADWQPAAPRFMHA